MEFSADVSDVSIGVEYFTSFSGLQIVKSQITFSFTKPQNFLMIVY
jgi:hypothetical protein